MTAILPPKGRDLRLDLFRGFANWQVFINHIPNNIFNWVTTLYYGFSDAADLFVFISGFTASFVYARNYARARHGGGGHSDPEAPLANLCRSGVSVLRLRRRGRILGSGISRP